MTFCPALYGRNLGPGVGAYRRSSERARRTMLLENPSTYVPFAESTWAETDFLREIARRTGCGLLLDVNNVFVSAPSITAWIPSAISPIFPLAAVGEIHLAGCADDRDDAGLLAAHRRPQFAGS